MGFEAAHQYSSNFHIIADEKAPIVFFNAPIIHLLPEIKEINFEVMAQQINVAIAITGMAAQTGIRGLATSPPITNLAMGAR